MRDTDAWNSFLQSGSVLDYLSYKRIHNDEFKKQEQDDNELEESQDEIQDRWSSY